jgi:hypothetical protein
MRLLTRLLVPFVVILPTVCFAADPLPVSPLQPTYHDCGLLAARFYRDHLRPAYDQLWQCMREKPQFGMAPITCDGRRTLTAWVQCEGYDRSICEITKARDREAKICQDRARAALTDADRQRREVMETARRVETTYKQGQDLYRRAHKACSFVNDPKEYLKNKFINRFPNVVSRLFNGRPTYDLASFDANLGYRMYEYAHQYARFGATQTANPFVGIIQKEALTHLNKEFSNTFLMLEQLSLAIHDFKPEQSYPSSVPLPPGYLPETSACKVIGTC